MSAEPPVSYLPPDPVSYSPGIGIIGCGNISGTQLAAYRRAGYRVRALCDLRIEKARHRRDEYFPEAEITADHRQLLARTDIEVVDLATHVDVRPALVRDALRSGKHVLSQKPFVLDLDEGRELADLADECGVRLAVNQNGRWAPHFSFLLGGVEAGLLGTLSSADFALYWPHDVEVSRNPVFSRMEDLILYDFGIHWFDLIATLFAQHGQAVSVFASVGRTADQVIPVPTSAQVFVEFPQAAATLLLRGSSHRARSGTYRAEGTGGTLVHAAANELGGPTVTLHTDADVQSFTLSGNWWENGMHGTMGELLAAIESGRRPSNDARTSLPGLSLCFAAIASARSGSPVDPRTVTRLSE
jgi:predicted dehydrogenase